MQTMTYFRIGLLAQIVIMFALPASAKPAKPNVIMIMVDDLGYGDLSCHGSTKIRTPFLDKFASEGIRLTSYYAGNPVCTPSRMALLTGSYPLRLGWRGGVLGYRIKLNNGLSPKAFTIAEAFKSAGYITGISGKWHLGNSDELQPMKQGFDMAYYCLLYTSPSPRD